MDKILQLDYYLFDVVNQQWSNVYFDFILKWMRNEWIWTPLYVFIVSYFIYNFKAKSYWIILFTLLTFGVSDGMSSQVIKKNIQRSRPCRDASIENITVRVKCGSGFSFTSSHATNHMALATFLSFTIGQFFKKIRILLFSWAIIICLSQVYVGVHFPIDVFCGALLGYTVGLFTSGIFNQFYGYTLDFNRTQV